MPEGEDHGLPKISKTKSCDSAKEGNLFALKKKKKTLALLSLSLSLFFATTSPLFPPQQRRLNSIGK